MDDYDYYDPDGGDPVAGRDDDDVWTDAVIEDTVRCCVCGRSFTLGGNDGVFIDASEVKLRTGCNGVFCVGCAEKVSLAYAEFLSEMGEDDPGPRKKS